MDHVDNTIEFAYAVMWFILKAVSTDNYGLNPTFVIQLYLLSELDVSVLQHRLAQNQSSYGKYIENLYYFQQVYSKQLLEN